MSACEMNRVDRAYPVGSGCLYQPSLGAKPRVTVTRSAAWMFDGLAPVVLVDDEHAAVALDALLMVPVGTCAPIAPPTAAVHP